MAAFADPAKAVSGGLTIQGRVAEFNAAHGPEAISIKLGLHQGPCIAVTLNDRLDYFGSTVNIAARLQGESHGDDIVLSERLASDPAVAPLLDSRQARLDFAQLVASIWRSRFDASQGSAVTLPPRHKPTAAVKKLGFPTRKAHPGAPHRPECANCLQHRSWMNGAAPIRGTRMAAMRAATMTSSSTTRTPKARWSWIT